MVISREKEKSTTAIPTGEVERMKILTLTEKVLVLINRRSMTGIITKGKIPRRLIAEKRRRN
jgi:hypothetical protein